MLVELLYLVPGIALLVYGEIHLYNIRKKVNK